MWEHRVKIRYGGLGTSALLLCLRGRPLSLFFKCSLNQHNNAFPNNIIFLVGRSTLTIFGPVLPREIHTFDCCGVSDVFLRIYLATAHMRRHTLTRFEVEQHQTLPPWLLLWKIKIQCGTHVVDIFLIPKWSVIIKTSQPCDILFHVMIFFIVSGLVASIECPEYSATPIFYHLQSWLSLHSIDQALPWFEWYFLPQENNAWWAPVSNFFPFP